MCRGHCSQRAVSGNRIRVDRVPLNEVRRLVQETADFERAIAWIENKVFVARMGQAVLCGGEIEGRMHLT